MSPSSLQSVSYDNRSSSGAPLNLVEPDSLANLVTNTNVQKCANAADAYKTLTTYAIKTLNMKNVVMYLDAGHAGWLGWTANIAPAAELFASIYKAAGSPAAVRGLMTFIHSRQHQL
jgi:cellulose 1,4-beta-cellobiosidase